MRLRALILAGFVTLGGAPAWAFDIEGLADQITPPPPGAAQDLDLAAKHFDDGVRLYREGRYELARIEFEAAYALSHSPDLLHNLSMTAERQGRIAEAIEFERRFFDAKRAELSELEADATAGRLARLEATLKKGGGGPAPPAAAPLPGERYRPSVPALALVGAGGAGLVAGIGCGAAALNLSGTLSQGGQYLTGDYQALMSRGQALSNAAIALDVLGGVTLAAGAVWAIVHRVRWRAGERAASPLPSSGPGMSLSW